MSHSSRVLSASVAARATVIRSTVATLDGPRAAFGRILPSQIVEAELAAQTILAQARAGAEQESRQCRAELDAYAAQRIEAVERECRSREERLELRLLTEGQRLTEAQEAQLLGLASVLAERLIGEQLRVSPATISRLAEEVLREARGARKITIFCAPDAKASLLSAAPRLAEVFASTIDVQQDASLGEGDLIIESELGQIVAKIRSRLDCLLAVLRGREGQ